ncbi:MAG: HPr family phosphocarrier protein [Patescibacteria group bacterium]|nr:HPr family phosphocarrier protein [Patescibacteria group bacterium]
MSATYSKEVEVVNVLGIHARPSSKIASLANALNAEDVFIRDAKNPDQKIDPKSIMGVMEISAAVGAKIIVFTKKENMRKAVDALAELIESGFGEELRKK